MFIGRTKLVMRHELEASLKAKNGVLAVQLLNLKPNSFTEVSFGNVTSQNRESCLGFHSQSRSVLETANRDTECVLRFSKKTNTSIQKFRILLPHMSARFFSGEKMWSFNFFQTHQLSRKEFSPPI